MKYIAKHQQQMPQETAEQYRALGIHPITAQLLYARSVPPQEAADFLAPDLQKLHDPFLFCNMERICARLREAAERQQVTVIYGDYDCDGVCGSVILKKTLEQLGIPCRIYLPDRATEGYGTNHAAFARLIEEGTQLFVTVDCGIRSNDDIAFAKTQGVDTILLDHHECGELPDTPYILNGKVPGESYPFSTLCGAGVAFKLAQALLGEKAYALLEFAGVATIADMVPLIGENRILAYFGLHNLRTAPSLGLKSLMSEAGIRQQTVDAHGVGFGIAPRINAAGRLAHGMLAVRLLLSENPEEAAQLAEELNALNERRQKLQKQMITEAEQMVQEKKDLSDTRVLMVAGDGWDKGVVGLAAAALAAAFHRPTVVLSREGQVLTGSARSIPGINLYALLCTCQQQYTRFGGHEMAAGLTFPAENLEEIERCINEKALELYADEAFLPAVYYDAQVEMKDINLNLAEQIQALQPFGQENEEPVFLLRGYSPSRVVPIGDGSHLKMTEQQADILWFRAAEKVYAGREYDLSANLNINSFRGRNTCQLIVRSMEARTLPAEEWQKNLELPFLRSFPAELEAFWQYRQQHEAEKKELDFKALSQKLLEEQKHPFGTVLFVNSMPGLQTVHRLQKEGLELREVLQLDANRAENCICYAPPPEILRNYRKIFLIGCFSQMPVLRPGQQCFCYMDAQLAALYRAETEKYFVAPQKLMEYAQALYMAGKDGFSAMHELLERAGKLLQEKNIEKIWFAWKVCTQQKLLQLRKNGKIYVIFNKIQPDWQENSLLAAAKALMD